MCTFPEHNSTTASGSLSASISIHHYSTSSPSCKLGAEFLQMKSSTRPLPPEPQRTLLFPCVAVRGAENRVSLVSWKRVTCTHAALGAGIGTVVVAAGGFDQDAWRLIGAKIRREAVKMRIKASTKRRMEGGRETQEFVLAFREENVGRC